MNCTDVTNHLPDYTDDQLTVAERQTVETHLATCAACRSTLESFLSLRATTSALPAEIAPPRDLWSGIHAELERDPQSRGAFLFSTRILRLVLPLTAAASVVLLVSPAFRSGSDAGAELPGWEVAAVAGRPRLADKRLSGAGRLSVGQWLETDADSRAKLAVGSIGEVVLAPNSRLRLVGASSTDHRLELARGRLSAFIWAPPRLFFVETPSAIAVDLGCAYTLEIDNAGDGELHVTSGYVALEHDGRESIVPAGAKCLTRVGTGPGTPFAADAPEGLRLALERFDFGTHAGGAPALREVLARSRAEDAVTLWHLLGRAESAERGAIFDRLAVHRPAPDGVTREGIVAGDAAMRRVWAGEIGFGLFAAP